MTIESSLERIAVALEFLLAAAATAAPAPDAAAVAAATGQPTPPAPVNTVGTLLNQAPPSAPTTTKPRRRAAAPEQTPPVASTATSAATAPAAVPLVTPSAVSSLPAVLDGPYGIPGIKPEDPLSKRLSDAIMALANDFTPNVGRDQAIAIMGAYDKAKRVSELKPEVYQQVFDQVIATYAKLKSGKSNQELI